MAILEFLSEIFDLSPEEKTEAEKKEEQPQNVADKAPSKLIFPVHSQDRYGASISFKIFEIVPPGLTSSAADVASSLQGDEEYRKLLNEEDELRTKRRDGELTDAQYERKSKENKKAIDNRFVEKGGELSFTSSEMRDTDESVKLYLPVSLQQTDGLNYATPELGAIGAGLAQQFSGGKGILGALADTASKGMTGVMDFAMGNLSGAQAALAMNKMATRIGKAGGVSAEANMASSLVGGVTVNPNVRALFKGVSIREFSFAFKFIAKSAEEAKEVKKIIRRFRMYAYPESIDVGGVSAGYKFPHMFELDIMYQPKEGSPVRVGNRMKKCYLKSIATNYNASSMAFHPDGQPVEIDLSLNFVEERTLTRADIMEDDGY